MNMKRMMSVSIAAVGAAWILSLTGGAAGPACDPGNGGITLPQGFCAAVVADNVGAARHLAVAPNGDLYVVDAERRPRRRRRRRRRAARHRRRRQDGHARAIRHRRRHRRRAAQRLRLLRDDQLDRAATSSAAGELAPTRPPEVIVEGLTDRRQHADKGIAFDGKGGVYVNVGAPSNACQVPDRQPKVAGQDPCQLLDIAGGIWRFDENKLGQKQADGKRYATGLRQMPGLTWYDNSLWVAMHNRDSLDTLWPGQFTAQQNAEWPAEYALKVSRRVELRLAVLLLQQRRRPPGDQPRVRRRRQEDRSLRRRSRRRPSRSPRTGRRTIWSFYTGTQFPQKYRGGVFVAFHGSWNRAPLPMAGYNITFVPFSGGKPGTREVFADGFAGKTPLMAPNDAVARPGGLAVGPDGSLYITEDVKGKIWRVMYTASN